MYNIRIKGIYLITRKSTGNDDEPIYYIGQASNIFERFHGHCKSNNCTGIDKAIKKHGITSFTFEILEIINKQNDRDKREKELIKEYINKYGESKLYNRQTGGKQGQKLIDKNQRQIDKNIRKKIKSIFNQDISYSIYLIAEHFDLDWNIVVNARKSILKQNGLKYDTKEKQVVFIETGVAPNGWNGRVFTQKQVMLYRSNKDRELDELANIMQTSILDLIKFKQEYDGHENEYKTAEKCCNLDFLNNDTFCK